MAVLTEDDPIEGVAPALTGLVDSLRVPEEFSWQEYENDTRTKEKLASWQIGSAHRLQDLAALLEKHPSLVKVHVAPIILAVASFVGDDPFITAQARSTAVGCLDAIARAHVTADEQRAMVKVTLESGIKPLFIGNIHPVINPETGRKLPRAAGGAGAAQDFYEDQLWKQRGIGCWNTIRWCIQHLGREDIDEIWPLIIPPVMTILEDYDPPFKIRGLLIVRDLLERVSGGLLKRTGIDTLFYSAFTTALTFLTSPETPSLLPLTISCYRLLVEKTTDPSSQTFYEKLWDLVSRGIINPWAWAGDNLEIMIASVDALPELVISLGIGSSRFLKAFIPQLSDNLIPKPYTLISRRLQLSSAKCLIVIIQECKPRIASWNGRILDGILRCWVSLQEAGESGDTDGELSATLSQCLQDLCIALPEATPDLHKNEFCRLRELDETMFTPLLPPISEL
ncbi:hypothetical protein BOTBODRAFT_124701 [Botryobasidium botryosum FD-172 SS1]|uniref:Uncharacterized protein n=1 Tax=Botryobasidium botryosum (strain FD-172 SS1) TaxID=930990 RepID=A0A067NAS6_BOTB1|nr:hypothetical protein BOTBODRAFT_124701 [Botryobasidium botryosum FD-172 SS1]